MEDILVIDKPTGMTSHDVVDVVRRRLGIRKVGHCGTLDPIATGVLVLLLNKATKRSAEFSASDKEYVCTMKLGISTSSHDLSGDITETGDALKVSDDKIKEAIYSFKGEQEQIPPMVSAKHHKGKRLYKLARKGIEIEREPQIIDVKEIEILKIDKPNAELRILCSKGTYIRTLCHDIGKKLGCGAHMTALRRTRSGDFHIKDAVKLNEVHEDTIRNK